MIILHHYSFISYADCYYYNDVCINDEIIVFVEENNALEQLKII